MKYAIRMFALVSAVVVAAPHYALAQAPAGVSLKAEMVKDRSEEHTSELQSPC